MCLTRIVVNVGKVPVASWSRCGALALAVLLSRPGSVAAQHHHGVSFTHPLIAESPTPDNSIRLDYVRASGADATERWIESSVRMEVEYALHQNVSIGLSLPYIVEGLGRNPTGFEAAAGAVSLEVGSAAYEDSNLRVGYGVELDIPIGSAGRFGHGEEGAEVEPYLNLGYRWRELEVIGYTMLGIPMRADEHGEAAPELGLNVSLLYHLRSRMAGLLEFDGAIEQGERAMHLTPGIKFGPLTELGLALGLGARLPLSGTGESGMQGIVSVFCHL